jgi:hypothetical protein
LRQGDEAAGLDALRRAFARDRFNARTFNQLELFEEVIARRYETVASAHFRLRLPRKRRALAPVILDHLERAHAAHARKYGFTPDGTIGVELYDDRRHYAVRAVGLPGVGALAVCFGRVVTGMMPSGRFNWAQVLWHELDHVFTLEMSRARVPRWLTEGLADHATTAERPEWARHELRRLHALLHRGALPPLASLDRAFLGARSVDEMVVVYFAAEQAAAFLARRAGMAAVARLLRALGSGTSPDAALRAATGRDLAALDAEFRADLSVRLAIYDGQAGVPDELGALERSDPAAARRGLEALLAQGRDGYEVRMALGRLSARAGDGLAAAEQYARAALLDS